MRKLLPAVLSGAMVLSFSQIAAAQTTTTQSGTQSGTYTDSNPSDKNVRYNIHQRGDQNSTQFGTQNQNSQIQGSGNTTTQQGSDSTATTTNQSGTGNSAATTTQQGTQNQNAVGSGNQQSQQMGSGHSSEQSSTWSEKNKQNRQSGSSAGAGASSDDDDDRRGRKGRNANKGWHKGWDNPASSGSSRY